MSVGSAFLWWGWDWWLPGSLYAGPATWVSAHDSLLSSPPCSRSRCRSPCRTFLEHVKHMPSSFLSPGTPPPGTCPHHPCTLATFLLKCHFITQVVPATGRRNGASCLSWFSFPSFITLQSTHLCIPLYPISVSLSCLVFVCLPQNVSSMMSEVWSLLLTIATLLLHDSLESSTRHIVLNNTCWMNGWINTSITHGLWEDIWLANVKSTWQDAECH